MAILEKAPPGSRTYWIWTTCLLLVMVGAGLCYRLQLEHGLAITGMSQDISWGLYVAQFTFLVGVAASAVTVVLPYYLHNQRQFARMIVLGELLAVAAVTACMLFVIVDLGRPSRILNIVLHPMLRSLMFWDLIALSGYLLINFLVAIGTLHAEREHVPPPAWIKPVVLLSIPWAISIHTVTAFLYSGLPGRSYWLTAILAPRFLASAFSSGPALLIVLCLVLKKWAGFDVGTDAIRKLAVIVGYATAISMFFLLVEVFTTFYSGIPEPRAHLKYLFWGLGGSAAPVPWMWLSVLLNLLALILLLARRWWNDMRLLVMACASIFVSAWIEKGLGLLVGGFVPTSFGRVTGYAPTLPEGIIVLGIWAIGALVVTVTYKITLTVWQED
jgi:molybdopterin-containing oxidoreductase family membrane subunit